ncbi:MAG: hypothetical protein EOM65_09600 [Synergistales bacterium]|nr:hypothetical protein [Synergistales bacterium]
MAGRLHPSGGGGFPFPSGGRGRAPGPASGGTSQGSGRGGRKSMKHFRGRSIPPCEKNQFSSGGGRRRE